MTVTQLTPLSLASATTSKSPFDFETICLA